MSWLEKREVLQRGDVYLSLCLFVPLCSSGRADGIRGCSAAAAAAAAVNGSGLSNTDESSVRLRLCSLPTHTSRAGIRLARLLAQLW